MTSSFDLSQRAIDRLASPASPVDARRGVGPDQAPATHGPRPPAPAPAPRDPADDDRPRRRATGAMGTLIDVGVVVVLVGFVGAFLALRWDHHRYDDEAAEVADLASARGIERIAWPAELRGAVPALLDHGVDPVLVDDTALVAQDLAVEETPLLVTREDPGIGSVVAAGAVGDLRVWDVDLEAAGRTTIAPGESVGHEYARPYRYTPIRPSRCVGAGDPLHIALTLDPGRYALHLDAFDPDAGSALALAIEVDGTVVHRGPLELDTIVRHPTTQQLTVGADAPARVDIRLTSLAGGCGDPQRTGPMLHGWTLQRWA